MDSIVVKGGNPLKGQIPVSGAKNTCLKLMCAAILSDEPLTLTNVPRLSDIKTLSELLESLGVEISMLGNGRVMAMNGANISNVKADYDIVRKLRASFNVLGPLVGRCGEAIVSLPGGCAIGARKVDLHLMALEKLGATMELVDGYVHAKAPNGLKGAVIEFPLVTVGGTENAITGAVLAKGTTVIKNAAREPDTVGLCECLIAMGANISGHGTSEITIEGVDRLHGATHAVIPDRIEMGTFMILPAITGGEVEVIGGKRNLVTSLIEKLETIGLSVSDTHAGLLVKREVDRVKAIDVATAPFPGFPTDLQAQLMAALCTADGTSVLDETIFENRFMHAPELIRMGADIEVSGGTATVTGVERLRGAPVMATDLRASSSLIMAGLAAEGETTVGRVYHLDRGYEAIEDKLSAVGADIKRVSE